MLLGSVAVTTAADDALLTQHEPNVMSNVK